VGKAAYLTGAICCYCRRPLDPSTARTRLAATLDHITPEHLRAAAHVSGRGRWVPACFHCNQLKGSIHPSEWFWFIHHHDRYWRGFQTNYQVRFVLVEERTRRAYAGEAPIAREPMEWSFWADYDGVGRLGVAG